MQHPTLTRLFIACALAGVTLGASGCFLQTISGVAGDDEGILILSAETDSMLTTCVDELPPGGPISCSYIFLDANGIPVDNTSTATLISEFGLFGLVIDPMIFQIAGDAYDITGTYDDGAGQSGALVIRSGFKSIPVDHNRNLFAEPHQQFLIAELPAGVVFDGVAFHFSLGFKLPSGYTPPVPIKSLAALRFDADFLGVHYEYYSPMLPCTTDMAEVAALEIPGGSGGPVPIEITDRPQGCSNEQYLYVGFGALPCDFDGDDDVDRDDLLLQAHARNAPAVPGDRVDSNRDGYVNLNDVRRCALQCTTPRCQSQAADMLAQLDEEDAG